MKEQKFHPLIRTESVYLPASLTSFSIWNTLASLKSLFLTSSSVVQAKLSPIVSLVYLFILSIGKASADS